MENITFAQCVWLKTVGMAVDKNNWRNNEQIVSKVFEYYKHTDPRSSMDIKEKTDEEKKQPEPVWLSD